MVHGGLSDEPDVTIADINTIDVSCWVLLSWFPCCSVPSTVLLFRWGFASTLACALMQRKHDNTLGRSTYDDAVFQDMLWSDPQVRLLWG